jgi:hypothetical protein
MCRSKAVAPLMKIRRSVDRKKGRFIKFGCFELFAL